VSNEETNALGLTKQAFDVFNWQSALYAVECTSPKEVTSFLMIPYGQADQEHQ
jgi:hypothetical protein